MAVHEVQFTVPQRPVGNADIEFTVKRDDKAFGRLRISKGALLWIPKEMTYGYRISWAQLDAYARKEGDHEKGKGGRTAA